jgi:hypothetical protein
MSLKMGPEFTVNKKMTSIICVLIALSLSLPFFSQPAACPMKYDIGGEDMTACACCTRYRHTLEHRPGASQKSSQLGCHCRMCHITGHGAVPPRASGRTTLYLEQRALTCLSLLVARRLNEYKTSPALFLLFDEKDHPPEVS